MDRKTPGKKKGAKFARIRASDRPQAEQKHPDAYERDLNPNRMAGQNIGEHTATQGDCVRASDIKELTRELDFTMDELREIPVVCEGARLQQGRTYVDLNDPEREPFTATGGMIAHRGSRLVPKSDTPYAYWNRLLGMTSPERTI